MKRVFNAETGEEFFIGKPFHLTYKDKNFSATINTSSLSKELANSLVKGGFLVYDAPKPKLTFDYIITLLAKRVSLSKEETLTVLKAIYHQYGPAAISLLLRAAAIELDKKYEDHISNCKVVYVINTENGFIERRLASEIKSYRTVAAFRTEADAISAYMAISPLITELFGGRK